MCTVTDMHGNAVDLDRRILHEPKETEAADLDNIQNATYSEYVLKLLNMQVEIIAHAQSIKKTLLNNVTLLKN